MPQQPRHGALECSAKATPSHDLSTVKRNAARCAAAGLHVATRARPPSPLTSEPGNGGKNECWGEKGSRNFLAHFIALQNKRASDASSGSTSRVIIDVGCNKGDYIAELSPLLNQGGSAGAPAITVHAFEAMPQNCKFIEKVRAAFPCFVQPRIINHNPLRLQLPLVVKLGPRVRLHCAALGDDDGTVTMNLKTPDPQPPTPQP